MPGCQVVLSPLHRKCKLVTSGPWLEVPPIALRDVSIIPESLGADESSHSIALWAVSDKGDVLCRLGVSELNPAVSTPSLPPGTPGRPPGVTRGFWQLAPETGLLLRSRARPGPALGHQALWALEPRRGGSG